jgi:hypothetical protein
MAKKKAKVAPKKTKKVVRKTPAAAPKPAATVPPVGVPNPGTEAQTSAVQVEIKPGSRITFHADVKRVHGGSIIRMLERGRADIALDNGREAKNVPQAKDDTEIGAWTLV